MKIYVKSLVLSRMFDTISLSKLLAVIFLYTAEILSDEFKFFTVSMLDLC